MQSQIVIIIGGTSGIGLETGKQLAARGLRVIVTGRDAEKAARVSREYPGIEAKAVDAASVTSLETLYESIGNFDHLVLCVSGAKGAGDFASLSETDVRQGMEQKFFAQFRAAQLALPFLSRQGSLTFVTAISARAANPGTAGLAAINAAIEAMVKPLARELRPLRVNAVSPGVVETPWWDRLPAEIRGPILERSAAATLVNRNGTAVELGESVSFVVLNGFVNGTVLEVDGGLRLS
jgi:NAD(P)-dependent dehydrogenase (short-subunit alcohol dehydrogenase family)